MKDGIDVWTYLIISHGSFKRFMDIGAVEKTPS
jgi:hypothetical protein